MSGLAMAFGAGALIAAVAYELVIDAFASDLRLASVGFACGALTFYVGARGALRVGGLLAAGWTRMRVPDMDLGRRRLRRVDRGFAVGFGLS
jgi:hypothetical protein